MTDRRRFVRRPRVIRSDVEGRRDRERERRYQRRYARLHGYFWLPCPICGDEFGGHERHGTIPTNEPGRLSGICPSCTAERQEAAEQRLRLLGENWGLSTTRWGFPGCLRHTPTGGRVTDALEVLW